jgi:flagellar protein FlaG
VEIPAVKTVDLGFTLNNNSAGERADNTVDKGEPSQNSETPAVKNDIDGQDIYRQDNRDIKKVSYELNKFMELLDADIRFKLHDKTGKLIVQVVNIKENKVLKEFPPHEMLDTMAKIRDYVGLLLDKKV